MSFITMMVARLAYRDGFGNNGPLTIAGLDANLTLVMVVYAYFLISIIQILGICTNDNSPMQDTLFALCGFVLYLAIGSKTAHDHGGTAYNALAAMCILTSFVYLADTVLSLLKLKESWIKSFVQIETSNFNLNSKMESSNVWHSEDLTVTWRNKF